MSITINIPTRGGSGIVVALFPRGNWDSATDYAENDLVQHEGSSYYAINSSTNSEPPSGDWQLLAAVGAAGPPGSGTPGDDGPQGDKGWSPLLATVEDGTRRVLQVTGWTGGTGDVPAVGLYVGASGLVVSISDGVDIRGPGGGDSGWSPEFAVVADSARRVLQVVDWTGGAGTKPATGKYVGSAGLVALIADGVDVRGSTGATGSAGAAGSNGTNGADGSPGWTAPSALTYGSTVTPNLNTAKAFTLTATGNFTLANPTNQSNGATFVIRITQDATGSRTCTFGSAYKFAGGTPPLLSVAAGAVDTLSCIVWGADDIEAWLSNNMKRNP